MTQSEMDADLFKVKLMNRLRISELQLDTFSSLLTEYGAIIAGGSVLSAYSGPDQRINDLDIYVNLTNAQNFIYKFTTIMDIPNQYDSHITAPYDTSFMEKNNILGRVGLGIDRRTDHHAIKRQFVKVDLMIVNDGVPITDVPKNFDLTFCKIWYDGQKVYTMHREDVETKRGILGKDYMQALLSGNTFTLKRMKKYTERGFTISFPKIDISTITYQIRVKKVISPERWVVTKFIAYILSKYQNTPNRYNILVFILDQLKKYQEPIMDPLRGLMDPLYGFTMTSFKKIMDILYDDSLQQLSDNYGWDGVDINKLLLLMMCGYRGMNVCNWEAMYNDSHYLSYFSDVLEIAPLKELCDIYSALFSRNSYEADAILAIITNIDKTNSIIEEIYTRPARQAAAKAAQIERTRLALLVAKNEPVEVVDVDPFDSGGGRIVPARCFSSLEGKYINTRDWAPDPKHIMFIVNNDSLVCTSVEEFKNTLLDDSKIMYQCVAKTEILVTHPFMIDGQLSNRVFRYPYNNIPEFITDEYGIEVLNDEGIHIPIKGWDIPESDTDLTVAYIPFSYGLQGNRTVEVGYLRESSVQQIIKMSETSSITMVFNLTFKDSISHTTSKIRIPSIRTTIITEDTNFLGLSHCQAGTTILVYEVDEFISRPPIILPILKRYNPDIDIDTIWDTIFGSPEEDFSSNKKLLLEIINLAQILKKTDDEDVKPYNDSLQNLLFAMMNDRKITIQYAKLVPTINELWEPDRIEELKQTVLDARKQTLKSRVAFIDRWMEW